MGALEAAEARDETRSVGSWEANFFGGEKGRTAACLGWNCETLVHC